METDAVVLPTDCTFCNSPEPETWGAVAVGVNEPIPEAGTRI